VVKYGYFFDIFDLQIELQPFLTQ